METLTSFEALVDALCGLQPAEGRTIIAVAGPPGAGKSTLADALVKALSARLQEGRAALLPMDGYHFDNAVIEPRGLLPRKGAPETFDFQGYRAMLTRLRGEPEMEIAVPIFDRTLDLARAGARIIAADDCVVVTEGNYLLLDRAPWPALAPLFDITVFLTAPETLLRDRLVDRWLTHNLPHEAAELRAEENDMPNARLVLHHSRPPDILFAPFKDGGAPREDRTQS